MKRFSMVVILGSTLMLLALAPQLRADGCDHFNYEHENTIAATSSWSWNYTWIRIRTPGETTMTTDAVTETGVAGHAREPH